MDTIHAYVVHLYDVYVIVCMSLSCLYSRALDMYVYTVTPAAELRQNVGARPISTKKTAGSGYAQLGSSKSVEHVRQTRSVNVNGTCEATLGKRR